MIAVRAFVRRKCVTPRRKKLCRGVAATCLVSCAAGCALPAAQAGRDADASINGVRGEIRDVHAALVQMEKKLAAGRDVNQNDKWTLRLLGGGLLLLGLSYPVGKLTWLLTGTLRRKAGQLSDALKLGALSQETADALVPMKTAPETSNRR